MKITVIGGGNVGTLMAAEFAYAGHAVTIYTRDTSRWSPEIEVYDADDSILMKARPAGITSSMEEAVSGAELVFIVTPASTLESQARELLPCIRRGQKICIVPGTGGAEFAMRPLTERGAVLFGLQRVHSIARLKEYGHSVYMLGKKQRLYMGSIPASAAAEESESFAGLFGMPVEALPNYLNVTFTPSNPILHTARLCSMLSEGGADCRYDHNILFYEEWDDRASQLMLDCDRELMDICAAIPLDLSGVEPLAIHYENDNAHGLSAKIRSIKAFRGLTSPLLYDGRAWKIDWSSRYFTADFAYGLKVLVDVAALFDVQVPTMSGIWRWYLDTAPASPYFHMDMTRADFLTLYA